MHAIRAVITCVCIAVLQASTAAQLLFDLKPLHPVVGDVEAVGSGQFGRSLVRFAVPWPSPSLCYGIIGIGQSFGDGVIEAVFYRNDGTQTGAAVPIRAIDARVVQFDYGQGDTRLLTVAINQGEVLQVDLRQYLAASPADAAQAQIRSSTFATFIQPTCSSGNLLGAYFALRDADDGLPGSAQPIDALDRRYQIIRDRGSLASARVVYDNSSWLAELQLEFSMPAAGPALQVQPSLLSPDIIWTKPDGLQPVAISNPNDTNPTELTAADLQVFNLFGQGWLSPGNADISSFAVAPNSSTLSIYFDRKTSRLWNNGLGYSIRCAPNSNIRDSFGNRVRSNDVGVQFVSCPSAPTAFQLLTPAPNAQAIIPSTTLEWAASPCASTYNIKIATDAGMSNTVINDHVSFNAYPLGATPLNLNQRYYWQVTATNVNGSTTNLGGIQTFRTLIPGDLNADGDVNTLDLTAFLANFGASVP